MGFKKILNWKLAKYCNWIENSLSSQNMIESKKKTRVSDRI
jgi:hypothetical protein